MNINFHVVTCTVDPRCDVTCDVISCSNGSLLPWLTEMWYLGVFLANVNSRSRSLYAIARPSVVCLSVCLCVCLSSVTFMRPTQAVQIFGNISTALGTLAIR